MYQSTKTYGNDKGLSCCFRQWRSTHSHCSLLHGYSIGVKVVIESPTLDHRNWVFDFGGYKEFKKWLEEMFDHTLLIAKDDPHLSTFKELDRIFTPVVINNNNNTDEPTGKHSFGGICDLRVVDAVGCEAFAKMAFEKLEQIVSKEKANQNCNIDCYVKSVEVFEHAGNSAIYLKNESNQNG